MYLDLSELDTVFRGSRLWSISKPSIARFRRSDHLGDPQVPLAESVRRLVHLETGKTVDGPVRLLTHLSYFGYRFNPVSFYFCFDKTDSFLEAIIAEINNTPWGEQHCYVFDQSKNTGTTHKLKYSFPKDFHVSPFLPMNHEYHWFFTDPGKAMTIHMENHENDRKVFDATMVLRRETITPGKLRGILFRYPLMTVKVIAAIYWNAMMLWLKGTPVYSHPGSRISPLEVKHQ